MWNQPSQLPDDQQSLSSQFSQQPGQPGQWAQPGQSQFYPQQPQQPGQPGQSQIYRQPLHPPSQQLYQQWPYNQSSQQIYQQPYAPRFVPQQPVQPPKRRKVFWIVLGLVLAVVLCGVIGMTMSGGKGATDIPLTTPQAVTGQNQSAQAQSTQAPQPTRKPAQWTKTHTFKGDGIKKTEIFTVTSNWKLKWSCNPASSAPLNQYNVIVVVYGSDNTMKDLAINTICKTGNTSGETEMHEGGAIYLDVNSTGQWEIQIEEKK